MSKISVAMTTYNGERYVEKQLDSLRNQTQKADEVIILDDCSTDATAKIVREYISKHSLPGWKFQVNKENLGFIDNFKKAVSMTTGEFVFLSDQDDEWNNDKIRVMTDILEENPDVDMLASSLNFIDGEGKPCVPGYLPSWYRYMTQFDSVELRKNNFLQTCSRNCFPGCTMCIRRRLVQEYITNTYPYKMEHDWLINLLGCKNGRSYFINIPLINYRVHLDNAIGVAKAKKSKSSRQQVNRLERLKARYELGVNCNTVDSTQLQYNIDYLNNRINFYKKRSLKGLISVITSSKNTRCIYGNIKKVNVKDILYYCHLIF